MRILYLQQYDRKTTITKFEKESIKKKKMYPYPHIS